MTVGLIAEFIFGIVTGSILMLAGWRLRRVQKSWLGLALILGSISSILVTMLQTLDMLAEIPEAAHRIAWDILLSYEIATSIVVSIGILIFAVRLSKTPPIPDA